jgi:glyoxylase-like metal-dependent hydrolase (beta-lactamase superfamily II)
VFVTAARNTGARPILPAFMQVIERGWLSCNSVVFNQATDAAMIDSGYGGEALETLALLDRKLDGRVLSRLLNTHCHSDHMGGNAALQRTYQVHTAVPIGEAPLIERWDDSELMLAYADQVAERFAVHATLSPGDIVRLGDLDWQVLGAPGHDHHALVFFSPDERILISGDALWENGFGVVFPALRGDMSAFALARQTLDRIQGLDARIVIPGHGKVFAEVDAALERAYYRLEGYEQSLERLARHTVKVMLTFSLLARGKMAVAALPDYVTRIGMLRDLNAQYLKMRADVFADWLVIELTKAGAIRIEGGMMRPRSTA